MNPIILPIAVAIAVIATFGIMLAINANQQPQITEVPSPPQIIYVNKLCSYYDGPFI